jgi:hypothetical protein
MNTRTNARGSHILETIDPDSDRYAYDRELCRKRGWAQYDTFADASYFGVWVHHTTRKIVTFAEGDVRIVTSPTAAIFAAELANMATFYGSPPPAATVIDSSGNVSRIYDAEAAHGR